MSSFANPPQLSVCAESYLYLNSKGHWRRPRDIEKLSCVHGRVFNNYLEINNRRFDNECVKSQSQTNSGVAKLGTSITLWSLRCLHRASKLDIWIFVRFRLLYKIFSTLSQVLHILECNNSHKLSPPHCI